MLPTSVLRTTTITPARSTAIRPQPTNFGEAHPGSVPVTENPPGRILLKGKTVKPSRTRRVAEVTILLLCVFVAAAYAWNATRVYRAYRASSTRDQHGLQRAISLEPQRATYYDLLGRKVLFDSQDASTALAQFRKAVELNPYESSYWLDLAEAYYMLGATAEEQQAIRKAIAVDPTTPGVAWNTANFLLLQGDMPAAMRQFAVVLAHSYERVPAALDTLWHATHDVAAIEAILPPNPTVHLQFLNMLIQEKNDKDASAVWAHFFALNLPFDFHDALFYVDYLINQKQASQALEVWRQIASRSPQLARYVQTGNGITDGNFAQEILNAGFDWHYAPLAGAEVSLDSNNRHANDRSLLITYKGTVGDAGLFQYIPVKPNTRYTLSAWVKSENLQTANGPQIILTDPANASIHAATDETSETTGWHLVQTHFQTGSNSQLLRMSVTREPARTQIQGQFWMAELSLQEMSNAPQK